MVDSMFVYVDDEKWGFACILVYCVWVGVSRIALISLTQNDEQSLRVTQCGARYWIPFAVALCSRSSSSSHLGVIFFVFIRVLLRAHLVLVVCAW